MSPYEHGYDDGDGDGDEPRDLRAEEIILDAQDEQRRTEQAAAAADDECLGVVYSVDEEPEHCGNDCGGIYHEDSGDHDDPVDCVHCECCTCNSCSYARHA